MNSTKRCVHRAAARGVVTNHSTVRGSSHDEKSPESLGSQGAAAAAQCAPGGRTEAQRSSGTIITLRMGGGAGVHSAAVEAEAGPRGCIGRGRGGRRVSVRQKALLLLLPVRYCQSYMRRCTQRSSRWLTPPVSRCTQRCCCLLAQPCRHGDSAAAACRISQLTAADSAAAACWPRPRSRCTLHSRCLPLQARKPLLYWRQPVSRCTMRPQRSQHLL